MKQRFERDYRFLFILCMILGTLVLLTPLHLILNHGKLDKDDTVIVLVEFFGPTTSLLIWSLLTISFYSFASFLLTLFSKTIIPIRFNLGLHTGLPASAAIIIVLLFRFNPFSSYTPLLLLLLAIFLLGGSYYLVKRFDYIEAKDKVYQKESRFFSLIGMVLGAICLLLFVLSFI